MILKRALQHSFANFARSSFPAYRIGLFSSATYPHRMASLPPEFTFLPEFFTPHEQKTLLLASLEQLDARESRKSRRKRAHYLSTNPREEDALIHDIFLPDELYEFEEGHYDGVIHHYREMHLSSWPLADNPELARVLQRLETILPSQDVQTHLLHLASNGFIEPHVDHLDASGSWILGVSLGASRILRMTSLDESNSFEIPLPSGSVYIQRDQVRYQYKHCILGDDVRQGEQIHDRQRLSIMIRDKKSA